MDGPWRGYSIGWYDDEGTQLNSRLISQLKQQATILQRVNLDISERAHWRNTIY